MVHIIVNNKKQCSTVISCLSWRHTRSVTPCILAVGVCLSELQTECDVTLTQPADDSVLPFDNVTQCFQLSLLCHRQLDSLMQFRLQTWWRQQAYTHNLNCHSPYNCCCSLSSITLHANDHNTVFGSKRSTICAQAVYFLHSTRPIVQRLSRKIWQNISLCGEIMKLGTLIGDPRKIIFRLGPNSETPPGGRHLEF